MLLSHIFILLCLFVCTGDRGPADRHQGAAHQLLPRERQGVYKGMEELIAFPLQSCASSLGARQLFCDSKNYLHTTSLSLILCLFFLHRPSPPPCCSTVMV